MYFYLSIFATVSDSCILFVFPCLVIVISFCSFSLFSVRCTFTLLSPSILDSSAWSALLLFSMR